MKERMGIKTERGKVAEESYSRMLLCIAETSSPFLIQSLTVRCHGESTVVYFS